MPLPEYLHNLDYPPDDWMKLLVVDPGTARCGLLALAVPGPKPWQVGNYHPTEIHVWAEAMIYNMKDAGEAAEVAQKMTGKFLFEVFIIDHKMGAQKPPGFPITVEKQFENEFEKKGVRSRRTGHGFEWSSPDIEGRELLLKQWIHSGMLKVHRCCTNLSHQMDNFFRKKNSPLKRDDRAVKELIDNLEYAAAHFQGRLYWNPPESADVPIEEEEMVKLLKHFRQTNWQFEKKKESTTGVSFGALGSRR